MTGRVLGACVVLGIAACDPPAQQAPVRFIPAPDPVAEPTPPAPPQVVEDLQARARQSEGEGLAISSATTPNAAAAAPKKTDPAECYCAAGGQWPALCPTVQTPRCMCVSFFGSACREHVRPEPTGCASGYESFGGAGKASGEACQGWAVDMDGAEKFAGDGRLSCDLCYAPPPVRGVKEGASCLGVDASGLKRPGEYVCGRGMPRPPPMSAPMSTSARGLEPGNSL